MSVPRVRRTFEPVAGEVGAARRFVTGVLADSGVQAADVSLIVSELATNAVLHARSEFEVTVRIDRYRVGVQVSDTNPRLPAMTPVPTEAHSGRGLMIVAQLADRWGVESLAGGGKTIWFEIEGTPGP